MAKEPPKPYGKVPYADPEQGKYPIDTPEHIRSAWSYVSPPSAQKHAEDEEKTELAGTSSGPGGFYQPGFTVGVKGKPKMDIDYRQMAETWAEAEWDGPAIELDPTLILHDIDAKPSATAPRTSTVQLARYGTWQHPVYGKLVMDAAFFQGLIDSHDQNIRGQLLPLDVEHVPANGAAAWFLPAAGSIRDDGGRLMAEVEWTPKGENLVRDRQYRYISPTFRPAWTDPETGVKYRNVLFGAALTCEPFLKRMQQVQEGFVTVRLSEFAEIDTEGVHTMADTKEPWSKGKLDSSQEEANKEPLDTKDTAEGKKRLAEQAGKKADKVEDDTEEYRDGKRKLDEEDTATQAYKDKQAKMAEAEAKKKKELAEKPEPANDKDGLEDLDDDAAVDAMCEKFDDMDADSLGKLHGKLVGAMQDKLKGKGAPDARAALRNAHKTLSPVVDRLKKDDNKESEEHAMAIDLAKDPTVIKLTEVMEATLKENAALNARLDASEQREANVTRKLSETKARETVAALFPRKGFDDARLPGDVKLKERAIAFYLSLGDVGDHGTIKLSETVDGKDVERTVCLQDEFMAFMLAKPPAKLNTVSHVMQQSDSEHELSEGDKFAHKVEAIQKEHKLSYHQATIKLGQDLAAGRVEL